MPVYFSLIGLADIQRNLPAAEGLNRAMTSLTCHLFLLVSGTVLVKSLHLIALTAFAVTAFIGVSSSAKDLDSGWPQWRGPDASGVAPTGNPPTQWSESENIRWKIEVPGVGSSTPIVLGDRVYVATAVKTDRVKEGAEAAAAESASEPSGSQRPDRGAARPGAERAGGGRADGERPGGDRPSGFGRGGRGGRGGGRGFGGGAAP